MEILILLIPLSVVLALLIAAAFWWSVKSGQFDDLEGPAHRILADDDGVRPSEADKGGPQTPSIDSDALTSIKSAPHRDS